jgi:hypothetical protein
LREERKKNVTGVHVCEKEFVWVCGISGTWQDQSISFEKWVSFVRWEVITVSVGVPLNSMLE